jgi:signal peptidase
MNQGPAGSPPKSRERGFWSYLLAGVSAGLLLIVVGIAVLVIIVPWATNSTALTVLTRSMEPVYPPGTLVIVQPVSAQDIRIGDPITYQIRSGEAEYVTHRVVAISRSTLGELSFTTKGDNNAVADKAPVVPDQIQGRVWYSLPWIGWLNNAVGGGGKSWLVIGLAVLLFGYAGWQFIGSLFDRKKKSQPAAPAEEPAPPPTS